MPTPEECTALCSVVYKEILRLQARLRESCQEAINKVVMRDIVDRQSKIWVRLGDGASYSIIGTMFYSIADAQSKDNYSDALASYKEARKIMAGLVEMERVASAA